MAAAHAWLVVQSSSSPLLVPAAVRRLLALAKAPPAAAPEAAAFAEDAAAYDVFGENFGAAANEGYADDDVPRADVDRYEDVRLERPSVATALMLAGSRCRRPALVHEVLSRAQAHGVEFNTRMVNAALSGYAKVGRGAEAAELLALMRRGALPAPDVASYTCLLKVAADAGDLDGFRATLAELEGDGLRPDLYVHNLTLLCLAKAGAPPHVLLRGLERVKEETARAGDAAPDRITYGTVLRALCDRGAEAEAERFFAAMAAAADELGGPPGEHEWSHLLTMYARGGRARKAEVVWAELEVRGVRRSKYLYNSMFSAFERSGGPGLEAAAAEKSIALLDEMLEGGDVTPDFVMLQTVARTAARAGDAAQVARVVGLMEAGGYASKLPGFRRALGRLLQRRGDGATLAALRQELGEVTPKPKPKPTPKGKEEEE
mmetsp:Transcript_14866/g.44794  ORF Transcript_14866/g.44794 Transcript_14866/m.44794 type:complete len:433 (-) Transcript_14866:41-1339(-)